MKTRLELLSRTMLNIEHNGDINEEAYATYKVLLDMVEHMEAVSEWLQTGKIEGVGFDDLQVMEFTDDLLRRLK